jgi:rubrerythrin
MAEKEYIERKTAYSLAKKVCKAVDSNPRVSLPRIILDLIDDLPAADVRPVVRGEWRPYSPLTDTYECDKCGYQVIDESFRTNYCPNCGADMREEN